MAGKEEEKDIEPGWEAFLLSSSHLVIVVVVAAAAAAIASARDDLSLQGIQNLLQMAPPNSATALVDSAEIPAFAKLQGKHFVYYMRTYSIILGRSTETYKVDFDIRDLGGDRGQFVSRHHARIFYNFERRHFALEVLGRNGCIIQNVSYGPDSDPVKLKSQDLIEISGKQFYFLLPSRSISDTLISRYTHASNADNYGHSNGKNLLTSGELDISASSSGFNADPVGTNDS